MVQTKQTRTKSRAGVSSEKNSQNLPVSCRRVQRRLIKLGISSKIVVLGTESRTSAQAARAIGCRLGQIAKSLVFVTDETSRPVLVIASGANRVDEEKIADQVSERVTLADAIFVREKTGFVIGGVAPIAHPEPIKTFIDENLFQYREVWAAGGHPKTVFKISPQDLETITGGKVIAVK